MYWILTPFMCSVTYCYTTFPEPKQSERVELCAKGRSYMGITEHVHCAEYVRGFGTDSILFCTHTCWIYGLFPALMGLLLNLWVLSSMRQSIVICGSLLIVTLSSETTRLSVSTWGRRTCSKAHYICVFAFFLFDLYLSYPNIIFVVC